MITSPATVGLAVNNYKRAALYFDTVIPVHQEHRFDRSRSDDPFYSDIPTDFLPRDFPVELELQRCRSLSGNANLNVDFSPFVLSRIPTVVMNSIRKKARSKPNPLWHKSEPLYQRALLEGIQRLMLDIQRQGLRSVPILDYDWIGLDAPKGFEVISIVSSNLAEVDPYNLTWDRVRSFRQDPESVSALRRYRNFWLDNYEGASRSQIEDRLAMKHEQFIRTCKKHDFEVTDAAITSVLGSKSLLATGAITLSSILAGVPNTITAVGEVLAAGFAIEIGQIAMSVRRSLRSREDWQHSSELMYLQHLRQRL